MPAQPSPPCQREPRRGFTLIELIACVAVVAIFAAIALPELQLSLRRQRAINLQNSLVAHLHLARATALWRRQTTQICPTTNGRHCSQDSDWGTSWLIFLDPDGDGMPDTQIDIIRVTMGTRQEHLRVLGSSGRPHLRYLADGRSAGSNQTIVLCDHQGTLHASVIINNSGRVRNTRADGTRNCPR